MRNGHTDNKMLVTAKTRLQSRLNSLVMLLLLLCVFGLLAFLSQQYAAEYDWTANGRHTLSRVSRDLLAKMPDKIEVTSYARENQLLRTAIKDFIGKYQHHKTDIKLHFINPDAVPDKVRNLGISVDGELIIRYQKRTEHVRRRNEQVFTNGLQRLAKNRESWIAFIEGHGERRALGKANHDLSEWVGQLSNQGYQIQPVNLANIQTVPDNTSILVIVGPRIDYLPGEVDLITSYIDNGGNLLWLHEPGKLFGLDAIIEKLRMRFYDGTIIDYAGQLVGINDPTISLITASLYGAHPITEQFEFTTLYPKAGAIELFDSDDWYSRAFLKTGDHAWVETARLQGEVEYNEDVDTIGPLIIGASFERELEIEENEELVTKQQRIVVINDGDFLSNTYLANSGNNELGTRIINWLASDDEFISIPAKVANDIHLDMSSRTLGGIGIVFLFILPITFIIIGISTGIKRKTQ